MTAANEKRSRVCKGAVRGMQVGIFQIAMDLCGEVSGVACGMFGIETKPAYLRMSSYMHVFKTIVFHVGPPKTGSTFLQEQLFEATEPLAEAGWAVPSRFLKEEHGFATRDHSLLLRCIVKRQNRGKWISAENMRVIPQLFRAWLSECTCPGLILSLEGMAGFSAEEWRQLKDFLSDFVDDRTLLRFIYFVRDPLRQYLSNRNQWMKNGRQMGLPEIKALPLHFNPFQAMQTVWGKSASFEPKIYESAKEQGLWRSFLKWMDLSPEAIGVRAGHTRRNASVSLESRLILSQCDPQSPEQKEWMRRIRRLPGTEDGLSMEEAEEVWSKRGETINKWLKDHGFPVYVFDPPILFMSSSSLWPESCVQAWSQEIEEWAGDDLAMLRSAFQSVARDKQLTQWHPAALQRFACLFESVCGEGLVASLRRQMRLSRKDKWRFAARLVRSVASDAWSGRRQWPLATRQLNAAQSAWDEISSLEEALKQRTDETEMRKGDPRSREFGEGDWPIPPRTEWDSDPFRAERFPNLELLVFHIAKTGGSSFRKSLQASSFGPFCFLSYLSFHQLLEAIQELPQEDRPLAFANAIAARIPKDTKGIQGHILFNPLLLPFLLKRPEVLKITWVRAPESLAYSKYAFIRQELMKRAPTGWRYPAFEASIFRDVVDGCNQPWVKNSLAKPLQGMPLESFDFVGITEFYSEDLAQIDALLNHPGLKPYRANPSKKPRPLTPEDIAAIRAYHKEDIVLYERALALRARRMG